ncbi:MAG: TrkA family potassium uptake protein [Chloroflexaceae bacterium]|jgi:trk system potassium uptake protein TrkA|nr:TrkA family potassium uptake protein [Chloroflexaceae bacterium]
MARRNGRHEFAVIGLGRFGASLALALMDRGFNVLGIDRDPAITQRLSDRITRVVSLDSTNEDALRDIDISSFDTVVVAIGQNFECNLETTVALKSLGVRHVVCKALTQRHRHILLKVGADRVVLPEHEAGQRLGRELAEPGVLDHLELGPEFAIIELRVPPWIIGQTLEMAGLRRRFSLTLLAVKRGTELVVSPPSDYVFSKDEILVVIGTSDRISRFCEAL